MVCWSVYPNLVTRTPSTFFHQLSSNLACVLLIKCRCAWHKICDDNFLHYGVIAIIKLCSKNRTFLKIEHDFVLKIEHEQYDCVIATSLHHKWRHDIIATSWHHKWRHDCIIATSWHHKWRHDVIATSWHHTWRHDVIATSWHHCLTV